MQKLEWSDEACAIGNDLLDSDHRQLFEMLNRLIDNRFETVDSEIIETTLCQLREFTERHFKREEALFDELDYVKRDQHKEDHIQFLSDASDLMFDAMRGHKDVPERLIARIFNFWVDHVRDEICELRPFFRAR